MTEDTRVTGACVPGIPVFQGWSAAFAVVPSLRLVVLSTGCTWGPPQGALKENTSVYLHFTSRKSGFIVPEGGLAPQVLLVCSQG